MSFSEIMLLLAEEWEVGYLVCASVCVVSYILYSVLLVRSCRKVKYDVGVSGMIPLWNLVVLVRRMFKARKVKPIAEDEELIL